MAARIPDDREPLPTKVADRLLARASEIDAMRTAGASLTELRAAAVEAGISPDAFDAALAELNEVERKNVASAARRPRRRRLVASTAGIVLLGAVTLLWGVARDRAVPAQAAGAIAEQAFLLDCLTAREAAELIRPIMRNRSSSIRHTPAAQHVLTVRGTPDQLRIVGALLEQEQNFPGGRCELNAGGRPTP